MKRQNQKRGFTLIEILVVIGIIAVLAAVVLVAVNPSRQFKLARDSQRVSNVTAILNALGQNLAEHRGIIECGAGNVVLPATTTRIKSGGGAGTYDLGPCIVPNYMSAVPFDPSAAGAHYESVSDYDTGYFIASDNTGRITISAIGEIDTNISVVR